MSDGTQATAARGGAEGQGGVGGAEGGPYGQRGGQRLRGPPDPGQRGEAAAAGQRHGGLRLGHRGTGGGPRGAAGALVRGDRPPEGRAGVAQKKSGPPRLRSCVAWWSLGTRN